MIITTMSRAGVMQDWILVSPLGLCQCWAPCPVWVFPAACSCGFSVYVPQSWWIFNMNQQTQPGFGLQGGQPRHSQAATSQPGGLAAPSWFSDKRQEKPLAPAEGRWEAAPPPCREGLCGPSFLCILCCI